MAAALLVSATASIGIARAQGVLTVAITAGDSPVTTGSPDQGFEDFRFVGSTSYDGLIGWDLSKLELPATLRPALATEWHADEADPKRWIFTVST